MSHEEFDDRPGAAQPGTNSLYARNQPTEEAKDNDGGGGSGGGYKKKRW